MNGRHGQTLRRGIVRQHLAGDGGARPGADVARVEPGLLDEFVERQAVILRGDLFEEAELDAVVRHAQAGGAGGPVEDLRRLLVFGHE